MTDRDIGGEKNHNARQEYCGYFELPHLIFTRFEQNSRNTRQCCYGHGQLPGCERAEAKIQSSRQKYCGYGQLHDLVCSQLEHNSGNSRLGCHGHGRVPDRERAEKKKNNDSQNYCGYGQLLDLICPKLEENSSNSRPVTVRWLTLIGPRRKMTTIHRITLVMASCLTLVVSSCNRVAVFLDIVVKIMPSCLVVRGPRREVITLDAIRCSDVQLRDLDCF